MISGRIHQFAAKGDLLVADDIGDIERVLVGGGAVSRIDVVDESFVQGPRIHLAFPVVDDHVAEA